MELDLSDLEHVDVPVEVLRELTLRAASMGIDLLLVGAAARDLVVYGPTGVEPRRATLDVDVAVAVDAHGYADFCRGWDRVGDNEHKRLVLGCEVDVVPFGGSIETRRTVSLNDGHILDVNGIAEAHARAVRVRLHDDLMIRVASLPAQAALKVLAWRDRHTLNVKDARDLNSILEAAAAAPHADEVWSEDATLQYWDYDIDLAAAYFTGRTAGEPFVARDGRAVLDVLDDPVRRAALARDMNGLVSIERLKAFRRGFYAGLTGSDAWDDDRAT